MDDQQFRELKYDDFLAAGRALENAVQEAQDELEDATVLGRSTDGGVTLVVNGMGKVKAVGVSPALLSRDIPHVQEAIKQAIESAAANASALAARKFGAAQITLH